MIGKIKYFFDNIVSKKACQTQIAFFLASFIRTLFRQGNTCTYPYTYIYNCYTVGSHASVYTYVASPSPPPPLSIPIHHLIIICFIIFATNEAHAKNLYILKEINLSKEASRLFLAFSPLSHAISPLFPRPAPMLFKAHLTEFLFIVEKRLIFYYLINP